MHRKHLIDGDVWIALVASDIGVITPAMLTKEE
jgi:hypothetical protein